MEVWSFPNGRQVIEMSLEGKDSPGDLEQFSNLVASPLHKAGVTPLRESMTYIATGC
ncbi:hypothetical protein [uncultured Pseudacidovorax sp.]|uniref:hypothetical protein n=1 Tax=uncultured Pseudacidovorax sp. TaxID=679313 RepID=UPI0025D0391B|nr:hypothetical protein [uncultured Pseudacidovorax sp.]